MSPISYSPRAMEAKRPAHVVTLPADDLGFKVLCVAAAAFAFVFMFL